MDTQYLRSLDEYICANYSDYVRISALEGYVMPEMVYVERGGNIARRDSACMRICNQKNADAVLSAMKRDLVDTDFTFSFSFVPLHRRIGDVFSKATFAKILPAVLARYGETAESAGEKLDIEPRFWKKIVKGSLYPEKNTVLALALVCRMQLRDVQNLLAVCGFALSNESLRDLVVQYLIVQKIFNEQMRDRCLAEYKISNLPIRKTEAA